MSVSLADVEQEVAARAGPFALYGALAVGTTTTIAVRDLRSTIDLGGYTDRWVLRRAALAPYDRQRRATSLDPTTGTITVDDAYQNPVTAGEPVELLVLDPAQELRPAVQRGLGRTWFVERAAVPITPGNLAENLSATLFWLTDVAQIRDVRYWSGTDPLADASDELVWYAPVPSSDGVAVTAPAPGSGSYVVEALRSYATIVNGVASPTGPSADTDQLDCPLAYAAAAGHLELFRRARATMGPLTTGQSPYADGRDTAKSTFQQVVRSQWWYWDRPDRVAVAPRRGWTAAGAAGGGGPTPPVGGQTWDAVRQAYTWQGLLPQTWSQVLQGVGG